MAVGTREPAWHHSMPVQAQNLLSSGSMRLPHCVPMSSSPYAGPWTITATPQSATLVWVAAPIADQSAMSNPAVTLVGWSRTRSSPGTPLRSPYSSARSAPI